jgi:hypothetical protein
MDLLWNSIDCGAPTSIEIDQSVSDKYDPNICPVKLKATFGHPANNWRGPVNVVWYQGGLKPNAPRNYIDVKNIANGAIFEGTKGTIVADFTSRIILPNNDDGDLTYYKRRETRNLLPLIEGTGQVTQAPPQARRQGGAGGGGQRAQQRPNLPAGFTALPNSAVAGPNGFPVVQYTAEGHLPAALGLPNPAVESYRANPTPPPTGGDVFQREWLDACKGKSNNVVHGTSSKTHCDFDYSGSMMEQMLLGLVAHRVGKKLEYDPVAGRVTNSSEANDYLKRPYRSGWTLNG